MGISSIYTKENSSRAVTYMSYTWTNELCENAILVGVLFYGGSLVLKELMTAEQLITFLLYQLQLGENLYVNILSSLYSRFLSEYWLCVYGTHGISWRFTKSFRIHEPHAGYSAGR